jgi:hypothetical protein
MKSKIVLICLATTLQLLQAQSIQITKEWSLIGATADTKDISILENSCIETIWGYDGQWSSYQPTRSANDLSELQQGRGYWIKGADSCLVETGSWYQPDSSTTWQWQLLGEINDSYEVEMYDVDLIDTPSQQIQKLQSEGKKVICYFSAGSWENWREDKDDFPPQSIGKTMDGWEDEKWLDISNEALQEVVKSRLELAKQKGCDAVEPDNIDGYTNDTGFALTYEDQLKFNIFLSQEAHQRGLAIALKNDLEQIEDLVDYFDMAVNEQCYEYNECAMYEPFVNANKPILHVEYDTKYITNQQERASLCKSLQAQGLLFQTLFLPLDLDDTFRFTCF